MSTSAPDTMSAPGTFAPIPLGGPTLPQERRMVTSIPGPRSQELIARKAAAVAAGVGHTVPIRRSRPVEESSSMQTGTP